MKWKCHLMCRKLFVLLQVGRLLERDLRNYKATVELVYTSQVLTVDYDDICEFTGDVDD